RVEQSAEGPEVAGAIGEIPPADRRERRLGVAESVDAFGPVGLKRRRPRSVPARRVNAGAHALLVQTILRGGGALGDLDRLIESHKAIEHAIGLEEVVLRVVKLQADRFVFDAVIETGLDE